MDGDDISEMCKFVDWDSRYCEKYFAALIMCGSSCRYPLDFFFFSDVRKSVHHHTIQINQPTRCNSFTSLLLDVYVWLNMFRAPLCPSSGAYNCTRSLWFCRWSLAVGALLVVVCQTTTNNAPTAKPEAPSAVVRF